MAAIMVPLDGSAFAEHALPRALALARTTGAELHLVIVRSELPLGADAGGAERYVRARAGRLEAELPGRVVPVVLTQERGPLQAPPPATMPVAETLARYAQRPDVELVVAATHGRGGAQRLWIGSVADCLLRITPKPLLLIRPDANVAPASEGEHPIRHIVVPLDGSAVAERAIGAARRIGEPFDARYTFLQVVPPIDDQFTVGGLHYHPTAYTTLHTMHSAAEYLEHVAGAARQAGLRVHVHAMQHGSPAGAILDYATSHGADLIAMTTSGLGGVKRMLIGSVADKVIRAGEVPVLVCNERMIQSVEEEAAAQPERTAAARADGPVGRPGTAARASQPATGAGATE